jgi:membrane protein implicated in regulation of membrane protease activity
MARKPKYLTDPETFNKEYERLVALRTEFSDRRTELDALIADLKENADLPGEVETHLDELKDEASNLSTVLTTTQTYADSVETYYTSWSTTKAKIDDEYKTAVSQNQKLATYIEETDKLKSELTSEVARSTDLLNDARNTLDIATNTSMSSVFINRSNDRKKARRGWTWAVFMAVIAFAVAVYFAVTQVAALVTGQSEITAWILRLVVVAPFAFFLYFVTSQYTRERDLEEKYAFKGLIGQTLRNNTKLLNDEYLGDNADTKNEGKILDFTIESMNAIYRPPYSTLSVETKTKINPLKSKIEAEVKAQETE